jgi:hypothetical protein
MTRLILLTAIAAGTALGPQFAQVAPAQEAPQSPVAAQAAPEVTDDLLTAFVTAAVEVAVVAETYGARIEGADEADRDALAQEAQVEMLWAVENTEGISVEQYVAIAEAAQRDDALNLRILDEYRSQADDS